MTDEPEEIRLDFKPVRDLPAQYEPQDTWLRRALLFVARSTSLPRDETHTVYHLGETWRLPIFIGLNLVGWAVILAGALALSLFAGWGWHALGPVLGYRTG